VNEEALVHRGLAPNKKIKEVEVVIPTGAKTSL
jgi:hypothetical protein